MSSGALWLNITMAVNTSAAALRFLSFHRRDLSAKVATFFMNVRNNFQLFAAVVLTVALFICQPIMRAEERRSDPSRPKIGLVLSGGGAPGVAHIGVLKALEEM